MFSDYVLRIYASQNAPVAPSCPVCGPILTILGVTFWGYPRERQNDVLKHKIMRSTLINNQISFR